MLRQRGGLREPRVRVRGHDGLCTMDWSCTLASLLNTDLGVNQLVTSTSSLLLSSEMMPVMC